MYSVQMLHNRFCDYKLQIQRLSLATIQWHKNSFNSFLKYSSVSEISQIDVDTIENWLIWGRTQRNWSIKTHHGLLMAISVFLNWCVEKNIIAQNPAKQIPKPKLSKNRIPKHLTLEQAQLILSCAKTYSYTCSHERQRAVAIFAMFMYAGLRFKELVHLKLSDVNFKTGLISVFSGKGDKDLTVPICESLTGYLMPYLKQRECINPYSVYFFVGTRGQSPLGYNVIKRLFAKVKQKSGIYFHPHMLRHTFATLMLQSGVNIRDLAEMMGHSNIETTALYLGATVEHLKSEINKHPLK
ncbi:MAG: tyrosine-type recombinase/integrase [Flavobacteriaceae bacterium]|nr:MAG: tyrosine-type recombinase/integrase [Flavobacteriaceae bacterium]